MYGDEKTQGLQERILFADLPTLNLSVFKHSSGCVSYLMK